jgi:hypothetical protein
MNTAQMRCLGCNKGFTHYGLSRHIRSTQNSRCHAVYGVSQAPPGFRSIPDGSAVSSLASIPNTALTTNPGEASSDHLVNNGTNEYPVWMAQSSGDSAGEFSMTHAMDRVQQTNIIISGYDNCLGDTPDDDNDLADQPICIEARKSGVVVVDRFPFGSPGAPIASPSDNATMNGANLRAPGDSIWTPFRSQCDWEIAHWAKMRGPTSSAVTELLAIPEVCAPRFHLSWR